jgi:hypothetical protein
VRDPVSTVAAASAGTFSYQGQGVQMLRSVGDFRPLPVVEQTSEWLPFVQPSQDVGGYCSVQLPEVLLQRPFHMQQAHTPVTLQSCHNLHHMTRRLVYSAPSLATRNAPFDQSDLEWVPYNRRQVQDSHQYPQNAKTPSKP